jgi:hypothetical protein
MAHQKIGQIKRAGLGIGERRKNFRRGKELVAVGPRDTLDALRAQHGIKATACAAVAIGCKNSLILIAVRADFLPHFLGNALRTVV